MVNVESGALQAAVDKAAVGETVVLTSDIVLDARVTVSNVLTIDLNGYTITGNIDDGYGAIYIGTKGVLNIKDSSTEQTGSIVNTLGNAVGNYGVVNIYGGTFIGNYALYNFYYSNSVYGKSTIYGGVFKSAGGEPPAIANCGDLTINGGVIESLDTTNMLIVTDGSVDSLHIGTADYSPEMQSTSISGGHITALTVADDSNNEVVISGGTFDTEIDSRYLAEGVKLTYDEKAGAYGAAVSYGLKVIATSSSRIKDLVIKDGQLIFIRDKGRIALDFKGKRTFYNQITELDTEAERLALASPLYGYYFVIDTACLWCYRDEWIQVTEKPSEIVFVGVELPQLGQAGKIYADTTEGSENVSVWDDEKDKYVVVADKTQEVTEEDILSLFY